MDDGLLHIKAFNPYIHGVVGTDIKLSFSQKIKILFCRGISVCIGDVFKKKGVRSMKFLVDSLPYYGDLCLLDMLNCCCYRHDDECPRHWDKYKVCSEDNPHECEWLKEIECDGGNG